MVKYSPVRKVPRNIKSEFLGFAESLTPGDTCYEWAESIGRTKIYFLELELSLNLSAQYHLAQLSIMRLPPDYLSAYTGHYIHDMMVRQWTSMKAVSGDFPFYSEFPHSFILQDGEGLVLQFQNDSVDSLAVSSSLGIYYTGGLLQPLHDV